MFYYQRQDMTINWSMFLVTTRIISLAALPVNLNVCTLEQDKKGRVFTNDGEFCTSERHPPLIIGRQVVDLLAQHKSN